LNEPTASIDENFQKSYLTATLSSSDWTCPAGGCLATNYYIMRTLLLFVQGTRSSMIETIPDAHSTDSLDVSHICWANFNWNHLCEKYLCHTLTSNIVWSFIFENRFLRIVKFNEHYGNRVSIIHRSRYDILFTDSELWTKNNILFVLLWTLGQGDLANNLANFELANRILLGEPNFDLASTNEYLANPKKIWRTEMRLGELHFELRE